MEREIAGRIDAAGEDAAWLPIDMILACESDGACPAEYAGGVTYVDVGIRRDLWVAVVVERVGDILWVREISTRRGGTFEAREVKLARIVGTYKPLRVLIDQTGIDEQTVERAKQAHGSHRVEGVIFPSSISPRRSEWPSRAAACASPTETTRCART